MRQNLFRREVIAHQKSYWNGKVILLKGISSGVISVCCLSFLLIIIIILACFSFTQRIDVEGEVMTLPHPLNISSPQMGYIRRQFVQTGDLVNKDSVLFELDVSRTTQVGNVSDANMQMAKEKITNAEGIISNLQETKTDFLQTTRQQISRYEHSLKETESMLSSARRGMADMEKSLASYNDYLKRGLITRDQYNAQHSLYVQQQNTVQSLSAQKMQLELQITQLRSDLSVKSAEIDNQISAQYNQLNDYRTQLVENSASGTVMIKSTIDGRVESIAVTPGQMVETGSSLVQIKQTQGVQYFLLLWLPDRSLPYVKVGDTVNIRYDAFPSDKFGQFSGKIISISSMPATRRELSDSNHPAANSNSPVTLYKAIVDIKENAFIYQGKKLTLANGLKARSVVFMEERPLYMWLFSPVYKIVQSLKGPGDE